MIDLRYAYFSMNLFFLFFWLILFIWKKNIRKEMLIISIIFAFIGPFSEIIYIQDWWHPLTSTNTGGVFEAFFYGFVVGGIASVIYEDIFKKRIKIYKVSKIKKTQKNFNFFVILFLSAIILLGSFYILKLNSLIASIFALLIPTIIIWIKRKDLILNSLASGVLLVIVVSLVYFIVEFLTPNWIQAFWYFKNTPNIILFGLPLDDVIWYFLFGLFVGPLYEYWQESKLFDDNDKK